MGSLTIKNKVLRCEKCFMLKKLTIEPNYPQTNVSCECCCGIKKDSIVNFTTELQKEEQFKVKCNFCGKEPKHPSYCTGCRRTYCSTCIKSHDTKIATRTPHYVIDSYKYDFYCSKHQDELVSAYCMSCYLNICQKCIDEKLHKSHRFVKFSKFLLTKEELGKLKNTIIVNLDKIDANAKRADNLIPLLTDQSKIKELKEVCQSSVRDNKAILMLVKFFYKMYKHAKHRNYSMIFNLFENMKFNPLLAPPESTNSIEKRRLDLLDFFKREFAIYRRFAASKRRSKTTVPNMRNVINENIPKDVDQKVNIKMAKIEEDVEERNYTALSKELGFEPQTLQSDLLGDDKSDKDSIEKETNDNPNEKKEQENVTILKDNAGQEIEKKDINDNISKESTENNDNNVVKDDNKEGNIKIVTLDENNEKKIEAKDEEKKEDNKIKENEDPNKKKEINFKVDDKIKNRLNFINNYNKPEEEKKESKVIDIRKLCAMEIEEQKKNERDRELKKEEKKEEQQKEEKAEEKKEEEKKEEKLEEKKEPEKKEEKKVEIKEEKKEPEKKEEKKVIIKEEQKEVKKEPARIRRISNKTIILHLTGLPIGMPAAPKTPEQIAKEEEEERKRKEEEEKKREEELAKKKIEDQNRQKRVKKALLRIKSKKILQPHESKEPTPSAQPNIVTNSKFSDLAKAMGNKILAGEPLLRKDGAKDKKPEEKEKETEKEKEKEKEQEEQAQHTDSIHEIIMNKPMANNGSMKKKKPKKVGFSDNVNANAIEEVTEEENKDNN